MAQSIFNRIRQITALHCWISSSPTFLLTCNRKYNDISTFPANSIPHHHCSAIFLYGHAHLLKLLLAVWLSALIMSDILEMGAFKKGEKYNVTGWDTARKGLHYIYLLGNRILKVNIQKLLQELQWLRPQVTLAWKCEKITILWHNLISGRISTANQMGSHIYHASAVESYQSTALLKIRSLFRLKSYLSLRLINILEGQVMERIKHCQQCCLQAWLQPPGDWSKTDPLLHNKPAWVSVGLCCLC